MPPGVMVDGSRRSAYQDRRREHLRRMRDHLREMDGRLRKLGEHLRREEGESERWHRQWDDPPDGG